MDKHSVVIKKSSINGLFYVKVEKGCGNPDSETEPDNVVSRLVMNSYEAAFRLAQALRRQYALVNHRLTKYKTGTHYPEGMVMKI